MSRVRKLILSIIATPIVLVVLLAVFIMGIVLTDVPGVTGQLSKQSYSVQNLEVASIQAGIRESIAGEASFLIELTPEEYSVLVMAKLDDASQIRHAEITIESDELILTGHLNGPIGVPFETTVELTQEPGGVVPDLQSVNIVAVPVPGSIWDRVHPALESAMDISDSLLRVGAAQIQSITVEAGKIVVVGITEATSAVPYAVESIVNKAGELIDDTFSPDAPGIDLVPAGTLGGALLNRDELYLALGDSLAQGIGVSNPQYNYVSRFHRYLEGRTGRELGVVNLGSFGENSVSMIQNGQLDQALTLIADRKNDGFESTTISFVTLDIGANDIVVHLATEDCVESVLGARCVSRVKGALDAYSENIEYILSQLREALEQDTELYVMTIYNPFAIGTSTVYEHIGNDIVRRLNKIIEETAVRHSVIVADAASVFKGKARAWTHIMTGDIHPTRQGYRALAYSFAIARERMLEEYEK